MRGSISTLIAYALGLVVLSVTSVLIYQWVSVVQVVAPPPAPPPIVQHVPPGMVEPMDLDDSKPAGRLLPMPKTGRE